MFYEQYLTIVPEGLFIVALCLLPTFVVCCLLLGLDLRSGLLNLLTIVMITVDTVGVMTLWGIDYNAVALINLVTVRTCRATFHNNDGHADGVLGPEPGGRRRRFAQVGKSLVFCSSAAGGGHLRGVRVPHDEIFRAECSADARGASQGSNGQDGQRGTCTRNAALLRRAMA